MDIVLALVFAVELSLLFIHEMDAIRQKEWRMFVVLKDMEETRAYRVFTLIHLPLYIAVLTLLMVQPMAAYIIVDIFLIGHSLVHILFRAHKANALNSTYSRMLIYPMGMLAIVHLGMLAFL